MDKGLNNFVTNDVNIYTILYNISTYTFFKLSCKRK